MKNNKKTFYTILFLVLSMSVFSQSWNWTNGIGSALSEKVITVRTDKRSNVIVSGYFGEDINMGGGVMLRRTPGGGFTSKESFVAKYDSNGVCLWAKSGGCYYDDRVLGMDVDDKGNIYITGTSWNDMTFETIYLYDPTFTTCCDQCFVAKLDRDGNFVWGNWAGGYGDDQGLDITTDGAGNSYVTGFMADYAGMILGGSGTATAIAPVNVGYTNYNYWVAKIDSGGVWRWGKSFGNLPWDTLASKYVERDDAIALDDSGNLYIAGGFNGTQIFGDTTLTTKGGTDIFLMKIDTSGVFKWAISGGSAQDDWCNGVATDSMGHVYITGEHRDSFNFGTVGIKNYDKRDVFVAKFDAQSGQCLWGKRAGSKSGSERGNDIYANKHCKVYVTGEVGPKANFGSGIETDTIGSINCFVASISVDGDWIWAATGGSTDSNDRSNSIIVAPNKSIYIGGNFKLTATYGAKILASIGKTDAFFSCLKDHNLIDSCDDGYIEPNAVFNDFTENSISVFPNPVKTTLTILSNQAVKSTLIDMNGEVVFRTSDATIDMQSFANGVYLLRIENEKKEFIQKKIVKQ